MAVRAVYRSYDNEERTSHVTRHTYFLFFGDVFCVLSKSEIEGVSILNIEKST